MKRYSDNGGYNTTDVLKVPNGWLITKRIRLLDSCSVHSIFIEDTLNTLMPEDFAGHEQNFVKTGRG